MDKLTRADLMTLEAYAQARPQFRAETLAHKRRRQVAVGEHLTLLFEDRRTIQMQIQEMLRIERIFEAAGIEDELDAYNPLIPDGSNWKATCLIEYPDQAERRQKLAQLRGVEERIYVQVAEQPRVYAIADEDMERSDDSKTAAVHFLRFEFEPATIAAIRSGAAVQVGVDHEAYAVVVDLPGAAVAALAEDFD